LADQKFNDRSDKSDPTMQTPESVKPVLSYAPRIARDPTEDMRRASRGCGYFAVVCWLLACFTVVSALGVHHANLASRVMVIAFWPTIGVIYMICAAGLKRKRRWAPVVTTVVVSLSATVMLGALAATLMLLVRSRIGEVWPLFIFLLAVEMLQLFILGLVLRFLIHCLA